MRPLPTFRLFLLAALVVAQPAAATECPQVVLFEPTPGASTADTGFTGLGHDKPVFGNTLPLAVSCTATAPPCGTCTIGGALPDASSARRRCVTDISLACTVATEVADCGGAGRCRLYADPPQSVTTGGVPGCLVNEITGSIAGTVDIDSGAMSVSVPFTGGIFVQACPRCVSDPTPNDGIAGGTCDAGPRTGLACDGQGVSPAPYDYGTTSFDCPPDPGTFVAKLSPASAIFATATQSLTTTAANPHCRQTGFSGLLCPCDTCNDLAAEPCQTNADCPLSGGNPGICGGRRCVGGTNNGAPCTSNSECPTGACNRPGEATQTNSCFDDPDTPADETGSCIDTAPFGDGSGECEAGPGLETCSNHPDRTCTTDAECDNVANACTFKSYPCFIGGAIGDAISVTGVATPPSLEVSDPTVLGMIACVPPSASGPVNAAVGLPGPTRNHHVGRLSYGEELLTAIVAPGGNASTIGVGPTSDLEATVTSPTGGLITILTTFASGTPPFGQVFVPRRARVTAPAATAASPIAVTVTIAAAVIPPDQTEFTIDAYLNDATPIPNCLGATSAVPNDPCISARTATGGGDVTITVLTSVGGELTFAHDPGPAICPPTPDVCRTSPSRRSQLRLDDKPQDKSDGLNWKWTKGAATAVADFGDPVGTDDYALCLYDSSGLRTRMRIPFGGTCAGKPCWQTKSSGFLYKDRDATPQGITKVNLKSGTAGKAQIQVLGKGALLPTPGLLSLTTPLQLQIRNVTSGLCWGASFSTLDTHTATQIKAKSD